MTAVADDEALVEAIAERVTAAVLQRLAAVLPRVERRRPQAERDALAVLLPAMWAVCGVRVLAVSDLMDHARLHSALAAAIEHATGKPVNRAQVALGRLLRRSLGCNVDGLQIHRVGVSRGVALWQLGFTPATNDGIGGG
jgi:hypothetical protein